MATWIIAVEIMASFYLISGSLIIDASKNMPSRFLFKVVPMALGLPLAFAAIAQIKGWPL